MSRLTVNDPFAEVFPELFRGFLAPTRPADAPALEIRVDVKESAGDYTVHAELPGEAFDSSAALGPVRFRF